MIRMALSAAYAVVALRDFSWTPRELHYALKADQIAVRWAAASDTPRHAA